MSTTRNNSKVCGDNVSLLTDTVHSLEVSQEFHFKKLDQIMEKVILEKMIMLVGIIWLYIHKTVFNFFPVECDLL